MSVDFEPPHLPAVEGLRRRHHAAGPRPARRGLERVGRGARAAAAGGHDGHARACRGGPGGGAVHHAERLRDHRPRRRREHRGRAGLRRRHPGREPRQPDRCLGSPARRADRRRRGVLLRTTLPAVQRERRGPAGGRLQPAGPPQRGTPGLPRRLAARGDAPPGSRPRREGGRRRYHGAHADGVAGARAAERGKRDLRDRRRGRPRVVRDRAALGRAAHDVDRRPAGRSEPVSRAPGRRLQGPREPALPRRDPSRRAAGHRDVQVVARQRDGRDARDRDPRRDAARGGEPRARRRAAASIPGTGSRSSTTGTSCTGCPGYCGASGPATASRPPPARSCSTTPCRPASFRSTARG